MKTTELIGKMVTFVNRKKYLMTRLSKLRRMKSLSTDLGHILDDSRRDSFLIIKGKSVHVPDEIRDKLFEIKKSLDDCYHDHSSEIPFLVKERNELSKELEEIKKIGTDMGLYPFLRMTLEPEGYM